MRQSACCCESCFTTPANSPAPRACMCARPDTVNKRRRAPPTLSLAHESQHPSPAKNRPAGGRAKYLTLATFALPSQQTFSALNKTGCSQLAEWAKLEVVLPPVYAPLTLHCARDVMRAALQKFLACAFTVTLVELLRGSSIQTQTVLLTVVCASAFLL